MCGWVLGWVLLLYQDILWHETIWEKQNLSQCAVEERNWETDVECSGHSEMSCDQCRNSVTNVQMPNEYLLLELW